MAKEDEMARESVYQEAVFAKWSFTMLIIIGLAMMTVFFYALLVEPIEDIPHFKWFYFSIAMVFLLLAINFRNIKITITPKAIRIKYGLSKRIYEWEDVTGCRLDTRKGISYGGYGIRIARKDGMLVLVYDRIGGQRVVLSVTSGKFEEFVFSTNNPDEVLMHCERYVAKPEPAPPEGEAPVFGQG
jgi:hypothetical protein